MAATYPATTFQEGVDLTIEAANQQAQVVRGDANTEVTVADGSTIPSIRKAQTDSMYFKEPELWVTGQTETDYLQLKKYIDPTTNKESWWFAKSALVSKPVAMGTSPFGDDNWTLYTPEDLFISGKALYESVYQALKGKAAEAGYNLVRGSFEEGGTLTNTNDVLWYQADGKYYSWAGTFPKVVAAGATPATSGGISAGAWVDRTDVTLRAELAENSSSVLIAGKTASFIAGNQFRTSAKAYGVPLMATGSAVDKLQEMINLDLPIWLDDGDYLIDKTLLYKDGMDILGPGRLYIVSDSNFTVIAGNYLRNDAAISASGSVTIDTYKIKLKCRMYFSHSDPTKPAYPIRFTGLVGSEIDLDFEGVSSGSVTDTNMPDFYYNNHGVDVKGSYILTHHNTSNTGGMWVRDVNIGASAHSLSTNIIIKAGTVIKNNGTDEALAFFNPSNGRLRNCGVESGVRIKGRGIGLTFLNFSEDAESADNFQVFAGACEVEVTGLRINQAAVKTQYCNPDLSLVTVRITGFEDTSATGFVCGIRNAIDRADGMRPNLSKCKVYLLSDAQPTAEVRGFDGSMSVTDCETKHYGKARFNYCVKNNLFVVRGGFYPDAINYAISNCARVYNPRVTAANRHELVTYLSGLNVSKRESVTTDSNGRATITHNIGVIPSFISVSVVDSGGSHLYAVEYDYPSTTTFQIRVYNKTTNANAGVGTFLINWKAEE